MKLEIIKWINLIKKNMWKDYIYLKQIAVMNYELCLSLDTSSSEPSPDSDSEDSFFFLDFLDFIDDWLNDSESYV